jgi:ornithine cyclodeaminase/alanine dehydrogenase-like protein (mu-crystallin family)
VAIFLSHADVGRLLHMDDALDAVETALREHNEGTATNLPRQRFRVPKGVFRSMSGALPSRGVMGTKAGIQSFDFAPGLTKESVQVLYSTDTGVLLALFWSDLITDYRTGAAGGVSIRHMARPSASVVGLIGAGRQARTQLLAAAAARRISEVRIFSPTRYRRDRFATEMGERLGIMVDPVSDARDAVSGCEIVIAATSATQPVFRGEWLSPGTHVISVRSSYRLDVASGRERREIDDATVAQAEVVAVDSLEQALEQESPEVGDAVATGRAVELGAIIAGRTPGRTREDQVTLFKCFGMGLYDVAVAELVYRRAIESDVGLPLPEPSNP